VFNNAIAVSKLGHIDWKFSRFFPERCRVDNNVKKMWFKNIQWSEGNFEAASDLNTAADSPVD
jgi:hypothetical protein